MINKREKRVIDMINTRFFLDEPDKDPEVTVFDFPDDKEADKAPTPEKPAEEKKPPKNPEKKPDGTKSMVIIILAVVASLVIGFGAGYGIAEGISAIIEGQPQEVVIEDMTITLNQSFQEHRVLGYSAVYTSDVIEVFVYPPVTSKASAEEYAQSFANESYSNSQVEKKDGLVYFVDKAEGRDGKLYSKYYFAYKNGEECWLVQFSVRDNQVWMYEKNIMKWAGSVEFD